MQPTLGSYKYIIYIVLGLLALVFFVGCGDDKRREVRVTEEQRMGEVQEEDQGEMIVE